jgi:regulatory protein YycI of two-component signal transduction system YycFG
MVVLIGFLLLIAVLLTRLTDKVNRTTNALNEALLENKLNKKELAILKAQLNGKETEAIKARQAETKHLHADRGRKP